MCDHEARGTCAGASPCASPSKEQNDAPSAISELQSVFPTILALKKEKPPAKLPQKWDFWSGRFILDHDAYNAELARHNYPSWTGHFEILKFPRELRDMIYFHYLHREKVLVWRRRANFSRTYKSRAGGSFTTQLTTVLQEAINLFLVSRQVYEEAFQVFCSVNAFFLEYRSRKTLEGALRLFPTKAGSQVQHVEVEYYDANWELFWDIPKSMWGQIVRDARLAKNYFPRLVTFTALWRLDWHALLGDELMAGVYAANDECKTQMWLRWLKRESVACSVVPPKWLKVDLGLDNSGWYGWPYTSDHEPICNKAVGLLAKEMQDEDKDPMLELEEAGKKWLEEEWGAGKRVRKGKARVI